MTVLFRWLFFSSLMRIAAITMAVVSIFMIAESFDKARFVGDVLTLTLLAEYLILKVPFMISEFMPVVVLIAVAIYMTEISHHHELAAMRAAGIHMLVLLQPLLAAGAVAGGFTFAMGEWVEPVTNERLAYMERVYIEGKQPLQQGVQWLREGETLMRLTPLTDSYFSVLLLKTNQEGAWLERVDAAKAVYGEGQWRLGKTYVSHPDASKGIITQSYESFRINSDLSPETVAAPNPRDMQWFELYRFEKALAEAGLASDDYAFQLQHKLAAPLGCLLMVILAYSLCSNMGSRIAANSRGLLMAVILGLSFYVFNSTIVVLVNGGQLPVFFAAWWPNIMFTGLAGYLLLAKEGY